MLDNLFGTSKAEEEQFELFRALNELVNSIVDGSLSGKNREEFLRFAKLAKESGKLGFYLNRHQRMLDLGVNPVAARHWALSDVLESISKTGSQVFS